MYHSVVFLLPFVTVAGKDLSNVYARVITVFYNTKTAEGLIGLEIGETLTPQITYTYEVQISINPTSSISAEQLVGFVLAAIPNSSVYTG